MKELKVERYAILFIFIGMSYSSIYLASITGYAQSSNATVQPVVSLPAYLFNGPVPGGYITGYVLDEDGKPIPGVTVSLLQDGQLWKPTKYNYLDTHDNPQTTRIAYHDTEGFLHEGSYLFSLPLPDEYTITAVKDGYNGSTKIHVGREALNKSDPVSREISMNITLKNYHQPTVSPEQSSYTGAIAGEIRTVHGYRTAGGNVSLWQDGHLVNIPNNPQPSIERNYSGTTVDYIFEHLSPGRYTIVVPYFAGDDYNERLPSMWVHVL